MENATPCRTCQQKCFLWGPCLGFIKESVELERVLFSYEPVKSDSLEFEGSGFAGRRFWALAMKPWTEQYSLEMAVRKCSP
jgi:hypothetical protein